jgi:hypothetical protein
MAEKRVTFEMGPIRLIGAAGELMWQHHGQSWHNLPQAGAVLLQKYLVEMERKLTLLGDVMAGEGSFEEKLARVQKAGLVPF